MQYRVIVFRMQERRKKDPRCSVSSDLSHRMPPLATYERRRLCVCAQPAPVRIAAHIYPPKVDRLEREHNQPQTQKKR